MTKSIQIDPSGPLKASIRPPGSKSITNRALVCAALARGTTSLTGALSSEDTQHMIRCLGQLGVEIRTGRTSDELMVTGVDGRIPSQQANLFVGNSGTTIRFLTALVALAQGTYELDGIPRMRQRPIGDLLEALQQLGANATSVEENQCPPVLVESNGLRGGTACVRGNISSQFLSGLLMAAPYADGQVEINVEGELVSAPYVHITCEVMKSFGVQVHHDKQSNVFQVPTGGYRACEYAVEPDASAASYFWAAAAITGGAVTVEGLSFDALQGDVGFCRCLQQMGCQVHEMPGGIQVCGGPLRGIEVDMNSISDTVQTLAVVALMAEGPTTITGVAHNRFKESDRIGDLARELRKTGAQIEERADGLRIIPGKLGPATFDTYNDHRMAMSLALLGLKVPGVVINDPHCTEKTYPDFFSDLARVSR